MVMQYHMMHSGPFGGYGWIFQLIILILLFVVMWWLLQGSRTKNVQETPQTILKKRLASGEITTQEYRKLRKELGELED